MFTSLDEEILRSTPTNQDLPLLRPVKNENGPAAKQEDPLTRSPENKSDPPHD